MNVLAIDIGGTHVKILASGEKEARKFSSGPTMTPQMMVAGVKKLAAKKLPKGCRVGDNANAFLGGFRLWRKESARKKALASGRLRAVAPLKEPLGKP